MIPGRRPPDAAVSAAIDALNHFGGSVTPRAARALLGLWRHRDQLDDYQVEMVIEHYTPDPEPDTAPLADPSGWLYSRPIDEEIVGEPLPPGVEGFALGRAA